jgi:hypothetical protein
MANHDCKLLNKEWVKFYSDIDPKDIQFNFEDKIFNDKEAPLSTGIMWSLDSTSFYSTFLSEKNRTVDVDILPASYSLRYDKQQSAYIVGGVDALSNSYTLYDKTCNTAGEGAIDLNINLGQIQVKTVANITHDIKSLKTEIEGFLMLDFFFSKDAMEVISYNLINEADYLDAIEYDKSFANNYIRVIGEQERGDDLLDQLEIDGYYNEFPDELKKTIVFAKTKLIWNSKYKAYVAKGDIGIHSILDEQIDLFCSDSYIIVKGKNLDELIIYLDIDNYFQYYFHYKRGVMRAWSNNAEFRDKINEVSEKKRKADRVKRIHYRYMLATEDAANKFKKAADKKYKN